MAVYSREIGFCSSLTVPSIAENGAGNAIKAPRGSIVFSRSRVAYAFYLSFPFELKGRALFDMYLPIPFSNYISRIESVAQHIHCASVF